VGHNFPEVFETRVLLFDAPGTSAECWTGLPQGLARASHSRFPTIDQMSERPWTTFFAGAFLGCLLGLF
jgi:hypothetical protein